jgi:hypothetical protein
MPSDEVRISSRDRSYWQAIHYYRLTPLQLSLILQISFRNSSSNEAAWSVNAKQDAVALAMSISPSQQAFHFKRG